MRAIAPTPLTATSQSSSDQGLKNTAHPPVGTLHLRERNRRHATFSAGVTIQHELDSQALAQPLGLTLGLGACETNVGERRLVTRRPALATHVDRNRRLPKRAAEGTPSHNQLRPDGTTPKRSRNTHRRHATITPTKLESFAQDRDSTIPENRKGGGKQERRSFRTLKHQLQIFPRHRTCQRIGPILDAALFFHSPPQWEPATCQARDRVPMYLIYHKAQRKAREKCRHVRREEGKRTAPASTRPARPRALPAPAARTPSRRRGPGRSFSPAPPYQEETGSIGLAQARLQPSSTAAISDGSRDPGSIQMERKRSTISGLPRSRTRTRLKFGPGYAVYAIPRREKSA